MASNTTVSTTSQSQFVSTGTKINTEPLTNAINKATGQIQTAIQQVQQNTADNLTKEADKALSGADKIVQQIMDTSKTSTEELKEQIAKSASESGFGAFSKAENWTAAKRLGEIMVCDLIAQEIEKNKLWQNGKISTSAIINLYLGKTFGDQSFMSDVGTEISASINKYLTDGYQTAVYNANKELNTQMDNVIQKANAGINQVTSEANKILNKLGKTDVKKALSDVLKDSLTIESINRKLSNSLLGRILKPGINNLYNKGIDKILERLETTGVLDRIEFLQQQIINQQKYITQAQEFIANQEKLVRTYIDEAKKQAEAFVVNEANKIIADISSKIGINLGSISGQLF